MTPTVLAQVPIPDVDAAAGIPAAGWLFVLLYIIFFAVHAFLMNYVLVGAWAVVGCEVLRRPGGRAAWLGDRLLEAFPPILSFAITAGVAPLLFIQVLYPQFFYTASILLGMRWFAVIVLVMGGFYGVYLVRRWRHGGGLWRILRVVGALLSAAAFSATAWVFTQNAVLASEPQHWARFLDGRARWHVPSSQTVPRAVHTLVGSIAVWGVWVAVLAHWARRREAAGSAAGLWAVRLGLGTALVATLIQIPVGLWFALSLPSQPDDLLMMLVNPARGGWASAAWIGGIVTALLVLAASWQGLVQPARARWSLAAAGALMLTLLGMSAGRWRLREAQLEPYFSLEQWEVRWQWPIIAIFAVILVACLAAVALMVWWWWEGASRAPAAARGDGSPGGESVGSP